MLQQTQVARVEPKYQAWLRTFPSVRALAGARLSTILRRWSGLGYNQRARRLRQIARVIVQHYGGRFPRAVKEWEQLPGIGPYTARAVSAFAFRQRQVVMETNVRRVVGRIVFGRHAPPSPSSLGQATADLVPPRNSDRWHHALMDLGAMVCTSQRPRCQVCPIRSYCRAYPSILRSPTGPTQSGPGPQRFDGSDRFWRGRIVASLLVQGFTFRQLQKKLRLRGRLSGHRLGELIVGLRRDGLVVYQDGKLGIAP